MHSEHVRTESPTQAELRKRTETLHFLLSVSKAGLGHPPPPPPRRRTPWAHGRARQHTSTQLTQNTADITLHRLFALRQCKLLLRAATPCGLGPTGYATPSQTHCSHILSAQTQAGARAHVLLRRTPVASEGRYRDSASNTTLRRRLHQALDTTRCTALLSKLTRSIRPVTRSSLHGSARSPIGFHTPPPPLTRRTYGRMPSPHGIHMPSPYGFPLPSPTAHSKKEKRSMVQFIQIGYTCTALDSI